MGGESEATKFQLKNTTTVLCCENNNSSVLLLEPRSVLDRRRSPSPPTSTSTLSSSLGGTGAAAATVAKVDDCSAELPPIPASIGFDEWETMLAEPVVSPAQDQTFFRWIMGDGDECLENKKFFDRAGFGSYDASLDDAGFNYSVGVNESVLAMPNSMFGENSVSNLVFNQHLQQMQPQENSTFFVPLPSFGSQQECQLPPPVSLVVPPIKRQAVEVQSDVVFSRGQAQVIPGYQSRQAKRKLDDSIGSGTGAGAAQLQQQQLQGLVDELFKAAEFVGSGNSVSARGILARLNHQLLSPVGKPLFRTAFYFKEALRLLADGGPCRFPSISSISNTPMDVVLKLRAYKAFSDVSPIVQFTNFTCIQAMLDEIGNAVRIHIVDFDVGIGGQWSALLQELAQRRCSGSADGPELKITAFVFPGCYHPLELHLTQENLCHFAAELNITFEFNMLSLDPFDPELFLGMTSGNDEVIAVNLPVSSSIYPSVPTLLRFVKQLSPKILISVDNGCDRSDLPFARYFFHAFQSCTVLLDSLDAAGTNQDTISKIERFIVQPRIENSLLGRHQTSEKILPWRSLFSSYGFVPVQFSNSTETQAECLLKRVQVRGFTVDKRQASLSLCWQRGELVSISAWRC